MPQFEDIKSITMLAILTGIELLPIVTWVCLIAKLAAVLIVLK